METISAMQHFTEIEISGTKRFLDEKLEELSELESIDKIEYLVELGAMYQSKHPFDESLMVEVNRVPGCVSGAYLVLEIKSNRVVFSGMAEAKTVNGFMAILLEAINGLLVSEFMSESEKVVADFSKKSEIAATLTPNRANALGNIYAMMKKLVLGFEK
ncbi:SufE family protein [archaeon]|nr:SufE family protein [archaeon]MBT6698671.1 SufE family protein [archaeon]